MPRLRHPAPDPGAHWECASTCWSTASPRLAWLVLAAAALAAGYVAVSRALARR